MSALTRRPGFSGFPLGLIVALALVTAVESTVRSQSSRLTRQDNWEWRLSARAARSGRARADVLVVGSSLAKLGVVPAVVTDRTGWSTYNLGVCAGSPQASYFLFRRAIESGARPRVALLEVHPLSPARDAWHTAPFWPDLLDTRETVELAWSMRDARFLAAMSAARLLPTLKDRHEIRGRLLLALRGESSDAARGIRALRRNVARNNGALIVPPVATPIGPEVTPEDRDAATRPWGCNAFNDAYLHKFFGLAREEGVRVIWLLPPVAPALQAHRDRTGLDAAYRDFVRQWQRREPGLIVVDGTRAGLDPGYFLDSQHLDRRGAVAWSLAIAETVRSLGRGARLDRGWVDAAIDRSHPEPPGGLEDFGESCRFVERIAGDRTSNARR